ncbi:tetratricopeptide [Colletotrichum cuscutae]|uniref:Tetratricopeptide n=1 Tax=Colletotrichum cuscutae TaxID=1209917 RepID=A0AAI9VB12_9PEZI|nr:tetratricopeptide [Colletotrichum cuscutae]
MCQRLGQPPWTPGSTAGNKPPSRSNPRNNTSFAIAALLTSVTPYHFTIPGRGHPNTPSTTGTTDEPARPCDDTDKLIQHHHIYTTTQLPPNMTDLTHFDLLPLQLDPQSKSLSSTSSSRALAAELSQLNALHRSLITSDTTTQHGVPPPPMPVNPKRSAQVAKLRDSGNAEFHKKKYGDAIKFYTLGLQMAFTRPLWEPSQLVREEVSGLYANRAQAHMALQQWAEGSVDAEASVEARKVGNAKAWWRRGKCLMEMGRLEEAREWVGKALEYEGEEGELVAQYKEIEARLEKA